MRASPSRVRSAHPAVEIDEPTASDRFLPPTPSRDLEALPVESEASSAHLVSRHRHCGSPACGRWSAPGTVQADLLMTPNPRRPVELLGPLPPNAPVGGAALQPPVENQQA